MLEKIVSGAQTGADRGGLDAAIAKGIPIGGWIPQGRRAEDGVVPDKYAGLVETRSTGYLVRTELNVKDSDATLILSLNVEGAITGGTKRTAEFARQHGRPCRFCIVGPGEVDPVQLEAALAFIRENRVATLNVAGPRESKQPGVQEAARVFMEAVIDAVRSR
jgi:hypothetical protein